MQPNLCFKIRLPFTLEQRNLNKFISNLISYEVLNKWDSDVSLTTRQAIANFKA